MEKKTTVTYKGNEIDLAPYFTGFPYLGFDICERNETIYYLHRGKKTLLFAHPLSETIDPEDGSQVSSLDFSKFNKFSRFKYNELTDTLIYIGDKENKEHLNLWMFVPKSGKRKQLTEEEYIYGKGFNSDETKVAFVARRSIENGYRSTLKILDLPSRTIETVIKDGAEWTFTWGRVLWKGNDAFVWHCNHQADRNKSNLIYYDRKSATKKILLEQNVKRSMLGLLKEWLDPHTFLYGSNEDGYSNLYRYDLETGKSKQLSDYDRDLKSAHLKPINGQRLIVAILDDPVSDEVKVIHPRTGRELLSKKVNGTCMALPTDGSRFFFERNALNVPFELKELVVKNGEMIFKDRTTYPETLLGKVIHGDYEAVKCETFDKNPKTGEKRTIHAFLLIPEDLPEDPSDRRAIITAFYGGQNSYSIRYQILLEAGFIIFSPAIRGSFGFGRDFYALIDKDLGGNEVFDLIHGARYLLDRFDLPSENQIGLQGGSHGGYEAMRALTFPPVVNDRKEQFDWGFAISDYGISNIIDYHETCNIPDWVTQKAGDPETEREKLMERSPVSHAVYAAGPLFLAHGENDKRVPVEQSRQMAKAMEEAEKPYTYVEFSEQGHGWDGLEENLRYYKALFKFLNNVT